jgi:hypothetical protein
MHLVKLACELPDAAGRSLSLWTCSELARELVERDVVEEISAQSVQRLLESYQLKPWRIHYWLRSKGPRDEEFYRRVEQICDLYTRPLARHERVLCVDEKTSIQPRPRLAETRPARPGLGPVLLEHEYQRVGALNLFAAMDTRSGKVIGICRRRKRQAEFIELLEEIDRQTPKAVTLIHIICDNVSTHHGKAACRWLEAHPRFQMHFTPVHCSWMNQVEQWFSIIQRKRLTGPRFANLADLETKLMSFIAEWNHIAHPFNWTRESFRKVLARAEAELKEAA